MAGTDRWARMAAGREGDPAGTIELPETGWGAHIAWIAGPGRVRRAPSRPLPRVRHTVHRDGDDVTTERDRTAEDQRAVDEDIADYLADAGIPPPPRGVRWSLRRPPGLDADEFWRRLNAGMAQRCPAARTPAEVHTCLVPVLDELPADAPPPAHPDGR